MVVNFPASFNSYRKLYGIKICALSWLLVSSFLFFFSFFLFLLLLFYFHFFFFFCIVEATESHVHLAIKHSDIQFACFRFYMRVSEWFCFSIYNECTMYVDIYMCVYARKGVLNFVFPFT